MISVQNVAEKSGIGRFVPAESVRDNAGTFNRPDSGRGMGWNELLIHLTSRIDKADTQSNIARHRKMLTNMRFYMGEQLGYINEAGAWQSINRSPGDPIYVVNLLQYFVGALLKDYVRSQAVLDVSARGGRMEARLAARPASEMLKLIQQRQMHATATDRDGKFCVILGNTFRYTICADNLGQYVKEPVTEHAQIILMGSSAVCVDCGQVSDISESMPEEQVLAPGMDVGQQQCPDCGSPNVEIVHGAQTTQERVSGFSSKRVPDIQTQIVDPFEVKLPLHADDIETAAWLRRERFVDVTKLRNCFQWAMLLDTTATEAGESPLLAKSQIQQSPGNVGGHVTAYNTTPSQEYLTRFSQYWIRPEEYSWWPGPSADEVMGNGEVWRAGERAIDKFPNGLYIGKNGTTILETSPEDKSEQWVHNRWEVVPDAIWGQGIDHVIQSQEITNEVFSLMFEHMMHNTTPPTVIDPNYLSRADWSNKPGMVAVLKKGAPTGGVGQAFAQPNPRPLSGDTFSFLEMLKGDMQLLAGGAFSTASGLPDVHTDTARGMAIQRDQALMMHVSRLHRKAEADVKTGVQQLRLIKKHNLAQFYFPHLSDFSEIELEMFLKSDVDLDFEIKDRPGSAIPRSELQKRDDLEAAVMFGGLPLGIFNPMIPRPLRRIGTELYNLPFEAEMMAADERNTLLNIFHLLEFAEMAESGKLAQVMQLGQQMGMNGQPQEQTEPQQPGASAMGEIGRIGAGEESGETQPDNEQDEYGQSSPMNQIGSAQPDSSGQAMGRADTSGAAEGLPVDPVMALAMAADIAPVRYRVDDHQIAEDTIIDFMKTDLGRHLSPLGELLLNDLITRHKQGQMMKMAEQMANPMLTSPMAPQSTPPGQPGAPPNVPPMMGMQPPQAGGMGGPQQSGMGSTPSPDDVSARGDASAV